MSVHPAHRVHDDLAREFLATVPEQINDCFGASCVQFMCENARSLRNHGGLLRDWLEKQHVKTIREIASTLTEVYRHMPEFYANYSKPMQELEGRLETSLRVLELLESVIAQRERHWDPKTKTRK
jgi:hypothetical protein